ncbi:MAG: DUF2157 domain-containing protein [Flavobacterium sp.]
MLNWSEKLTQKLFENQLISEEQNREVKEYRAKNIFSVNAELLFLLYLSVILFTSGIGVFVYKNIDSIGHLAILALNFILMAICFFLCFKKAKGYSNHEVLFENPIYDYLLLTGSLLAGIFLGYINYQYHVFGTDYRWVSLLTAILCFAASYYFDNKTVLSMAITALTAFVGITLNPKALIENEIYNNLSLMYSGVLLGAALVLWAEFSVKNDIKKHFHFVYATLSLHLIGICLIAGLLNEQWYVFVLFAIGYVLYFVKASYRLNATSLFVFTLIYGYISLNILLGRMFEFIGFEYLSSIIVLLAPVFYIGSIVLFIKLIRDFNKNKHGSIR